MNFFASDAPSIDPATAISDQMSSVNLALVPRSEIPDERPSDAVIDTETAVVVGAEVRSDERPKFTRTEAVQSAAAALASAKRRVVLVYFAYDLEFV